MKTTATVAGLLGAATVTAAATGLLGAVLARRVVLPGRPKQTPVIAGTDTTLTVPATAQTTHPGQFGVWFDHDRGHAVIGDVLRHDHHAGTVTRAVSTVTRGDLRNAVEVRWTGHVFADHTALHPDARQVSVPVAGGEAPAWLIPAPASTRQNSWAIHVHGIRTTRITALRTVPAAQAAGLTSLVIAYRGDGEGPATPGDASTLGQNEWHDVDAAISYARQHGAERVVLVGWSMGASPVLLAAERSPQRAAIAGVVLVSPVTDWRAAIRAGAARAHLPGRLGDLGIAALRSRILSRLVGLAEPIDFALLTWTTRPRLDRPCLVLHAGDDTESPIQQSRRFAAVNPGHVELIEFPGAAHAWEYNLASDRFTHAIAHWLETVLP